MFSGGSPPPDGLSVPSLRKELAMVAIFVEGHTLRYGRGEARQSERMASDDVDRAMSPGHGCEINHPGL
ncbi:hypothetical protein SAMN05892877_10129 [Rhizobium subbaraonis]|uniref:Uncharacterized protein n=1 Tax=Rhizobium subbaraonis TaxID=908946 RepID=A0A285TZ06_9HYPH|nr:hypothetical protein SAMN05892877_10129 [Rhizobium subbaraonis]